MNIKREKTDKSFDIIFIVLSILYYISISVLYISVTLDMQLLVNFIGVIIVLMALPFIFALMEYRQDNSEKKIVVSHGLILLYFFLEILLDYFLMTPIREILWCHISYMVFFFIASFSLIDGYSRISKWKGFFVSATFLVLIGRLMYMIFTD
jgi:hypothetical protein